MKLISCAILLIFTSVVALLAQGSLNPPTAPAPTMKTLLQIEPRTPIDHVPFAITNAGSYYVVSNLFGSPATGGIGIYTNNVFIDLNGFALRGAGNVAGVFALVSCTNIAVMNGSVINWGDGVSLSGVHGGRIVNVHASENRSFGIYGGANSIIESCTATANDAGILADNGSRIAGCVARSNSAAGFFVVGPATVVNCVAEGNGTDGIDASRNTMVLDSSAAGNGRHGISVFDQSVIKNCVARANGTNGLDLRVDCVVRESSSYNNGGHGIWTESGSLIVGNHCTRNGISSVGAGVRASSDCRVEANHLHGNDYGVFLPPSAQGTVIIRNTFRLNSTNLSAGAANVIGPAVTSANVATNSNPHANYYP